MRLILFFLLCASFRGALAEPIPPHLGEWAFTDYFSFYRSAGNYVNPGTSSTDLPNGGYFQTIQDQLTVNWDTTKDIRLEATLGYGYSTASSNASTTTGQGFNEASAGAQYWYRSQKYALVPTVHAGFPFYRTNQTTTTDSLISTPSIWGEIGGWAIGYFRPFAAYGYVGYRYQDSGLAGEVPYDLGGSYRFSFARFRLGVRGEAAANSDQYSSTPGQRNVILDRVDNFSMKYYSVNPSVAEVYGEFDYLFMREWEAGLGAAQAFYGSNAAQGWTITAMVRFRLPGDWSSDNTNNYYAPPSKNNGNGGSDGTVTPVFKENTEHYDEHLFEQSNPDEVNPKPKTKSIDKIFNDTEKSLEKKNGSGN